MWQALRRIEFVDGDEEMKEAIKNGGGHRTSKQRVLLSSAAEKGWTPAALCTGDAARRACLTWGLSGEQRGGGRRSSKKAYLFLHGPVVRERGVRSSAFVLGRGGGREEGELVEDRTGQDGGAAEMSAGETEDGGGRERAQKGTHRQRAAAPGS